MHPEVNKLEKKKAQAKTDIDDFQIGDTVDVYIEVSEDGKKRVQRFQGIVIRQKGSNIRKTFTVRKISFGEGVEKVFQLHAPSIKKVKVLRKGKVRRSKLYYLRKQVGKKAKVKEKT